MPTKLRHRVQDREHARETCLPAGLTHFSKTNKNIHREVQGWVYEALSTLGGDWETTHSYHSLPALKNQTSFKSLGLVGQEVCFPNRYLPVISGFDFLYSVLCLWALCCRQGRRESAVCESKPFLLAYDTAWTCSNGRDLCLSSQFHFSSCSLPACLFCYSLGAGKWHYSSHWYVR